ncbi:hypothetical protein V5O48_014399 [Marasmius crinis-equi]|uniref:Uncharacterized protein n=1 Tax=Marasmius crinis-equi TaxID=585013 RepID=A0ABR3EXF9_9AGAR
MGLPSIISNDSSGLLVAPSPSIFGHPSRHYRHMIRAKVHGWRSLRHVTGQVIPHGTTFEKIWCALQDSDERVWGCEVGFWGRRVEVGISLRGKLETLDGRLVQTRLPRTFSGITRPTFPDLECGQVSFVGLGLERVMRTDESDVGQTSLCGKNDLAFPTQFLHHYVGARQSRSFRPPFFASTPKNERSPTQAGYSSLFEMLVTGLGTAIDDFFPWFIEAVVGCQSLKGVGSKAVARIGIEC